MIQQTGELQSLGGKLNSTTFDTQETSDPQLGLVPVPQQVKTQAGKSHLSSQATSLYFAIRKKQTQVPGCLETQHPPAGPTQGVLQSLFLSTRSETVLQR